LKLRIYIIFLLLICNSIQLICQITAPVGYLTTSRDTIPKVNVDSTRLAPDSIVPSPILKDSVAWRLSSDAIDQEVIYDARDSSRIDLVNDRIYLYGGAELQYEKIKINANYMVVDFGSSVIEGYFRKDSTDTSKDKPTFTDGENTATYESVRFNFKSKKGFMKESATQQGEFTLRGKATKYKGGQTDSTGVTTDDVLFEQDAIITPCNHDPPHFGIRAGKMKFVPNKLAVLSVAQIEIAKVPTPLFLPFGFFPLTKGKSSGLIFPSSYEYNDQLGLGFREIGYYYPINDYVDLRVTGDIYTRGSHGVRINTNYRKRYGYTGNILLGYSNNFLDNEKDGSKLSQKSFSIGVRHSQDNKAHPYRNIGGSVNIQTNRYDQRVYENPQAALTSQYSSNFTFSHDMPGTPFRFSAEFRHSQNTQTRVMDITLPNMTLRMNTIFPFKRKNVTTERWTDNVALSYSSEFRNFVKTTDTTLFTLQTLKDLQTGLQQRASMSTNFRLFKYINASPNINYEETWLLKKYQLAFNKDSVILDAQTGDTLGFKPPVASFASDLSAFRNLNAGIALNTQVFGTKKWSKGFLRGVRHVVKPSMQFFYKPENKDRYEALVDTDTREAFNTPRRYSIYTNSPYGTLTGSEEQMGIGYGITNVFEAKYWSRKDTTEKIIRLFDNISVNGNYNFIADSIKWSNLNMTGNTTVLKGLTNFNFRAVWSPYVYDAKGRITKETVWSRSSRPLEFKNFSGQFSTAVSFGKIREILTGSGKDQSNDDSSRIRKKEEAQTENEDEASGVKKPEPPETSLAEWFENFSFSHALNFEYRNETGRDTLFVSSHSLNINGSIPLTRNWTMNIGNIAYDIKNKSFVYPYFSFARDLHCWQMNFTWAPSNGVYSFFIGVKSSALSFMKYDYGQRNANTLFTGQRR
jgi:hypothetical protein